MLRLILRFLKSTYFVLCLGFLIGFSIGCYFIPQSKTRLTEESNIIFDDLTKTDTVYVQYNDWLKLNGYKRKHINADVVSYANKTTIETESQFLKQKINILCIIFVKKSSKAEGILHTWGKHCNKIIFFSNKKVKVSDHAPVILLKPKSSWHYLCNALRHIWKEYSTELQWVIFAPDDIFVIPENLRLFVAALDHTQPYYLGHALTLWNEEYNVAQAGYVLSSGALSDILFKFNSSAMCQSSGKYWKNEDYYLGKYLGEIGIYPIDTRDHLGRGRFHGYNFNQLLFTRKLSPLGSYWKRSVYPVTEGKECCSDTSITFHGIEEDKVYQFYYLLYHLKSFFRGGNLGNMPAPTPIPDQDVWRYFLLAEGLISSLDQEVSAEQFYELTKNKVMPPSAFNEAIRRQHEIHDI